VSTDSNFSAIISQAAHSANSGATRYLDVTGLSPATPYYFRVKVNGGGTGSTYEVDSVSWTSISINTAGADANFPSLSGNQFITNPENSQVVVALVSAGNPTPTLSLEGGYDSSKFTLVDDGDGTGTLKLTAAPNYESATDSSGDGWNTYRTYVKATNSLGSESLFYKFTVTDVVDYPVPTITGLGLGAGVYYDPPEGTSIEFHFDLKPGVPSYQIQFASDVNFNNIIYSTNTYVPNSGYGYYLASGLSPQTTYWIRVKGNPGGSTLYELPSVNWATFSATTAGIAPVITSHSNDTTTYQIANPENTQEIVNLTATGTPTPSWSLDTNLPTPSNNEDAGDFTLVDNGNGTATLKLTSSPDYEAPADGNSVSPNNTYYVRPIATNSVGDSTANFLFNVTDAADVTAPQVTGLTTTYNSTLSGGPAMVWNWNDVSYGAGYKFQIATDSGFSSVHVSRDDLTASGFYTANAASMSIVAAFLPGGNGATFDAQPGTTYWVRAKALGGGPGAVWEADGNWSTVVSFVADANIAFVDNISAIDGGSFHQFFLKGGPDYVNYVNIHGDLLSHYNGGYDWHWYGGDSAGPRPGVSPSNSRGKYEFGKSHYLLAGEAEGRTINNMGGEAGVAWGVGRNAQGAVGDPNTPTNITTNTHVSFPVNAINGVNEIVCGQYHNFFFLNDKRIFANGDNYSYELMTDVGYQQIGSNTPYYPNTVNPLPFTLASPDGGEYIFDRIVGGNGCTYFLTRDGSAYPAGVVRGVGGNSGGQLGAGSDPILSLGAMPGAAVLDLGSTMGNSGGVVEIFVGHRTVFFLKDDGSLWGMGRNTTGVLGDGTTLDRNYGIQVFAPGGGFGTRAEQVSIGGSHALFVMDNGDLMATGGNENGQLGIGNTSNKSSPVGVTTSVIMASAGLYHSHFLKSDGSLWAMGDNRYGQLGDGSTTDRHSPVCINGSVGEEPQDVVAINCMSWCSTFLKSDGTVWITGWSEYGMNSQGPDDVTNDNDNLLPQRAQWS
jgi:alpha-tubulin suppressor-like RCC1 family protein